MEPVGDLDSDRLGEARRFLEPRGGVAARFGAEIGKDDEGAGAAGVIALLAVEDAQAAGSSSSASAKFTGCSGCPVETACL